MNQPPPLPPPMSSGAGVTQQPFRLKALLFLGAGVLLLVICRHEIAKIVFAKDPAVTWDWTVQKESHFLRRDTYQLSVFVYHEAEEPLSGNLMFLVQGPCKLHQFDARSMRRIEDNGNGRYLVRVSDWKPGKNNLEFLTFDLDSLELNQNGLSEDEVKNASRGKLLLASFPRQTARTGSSIVHVARAGTEFP